YIDDKKEMITVLVKPAHPEEELELTRQVLKKIEAVIAKFNEDNPVGATLKEGYEGIVEGSTVTYGYSGGYKITLDDSDSIMKALAPSSIVAFVGILLYVIVFLRSPVATFLLMFTLVAATVVTFAFAQLAIGSLNTITAILGAILMGLGIDFGIHLLYRLREEYSREQDIQTAIAETLEHSGSASAASALTTASALYVLVFAHLNAFVEFGIIMGTGVLIQALAMYLAIPTFYVLISRFWPGVMKSLIVKKQASEDLEGLKSRSFPWARGIIVGSVLLTAGLAYFASNAEFDYDSRSLMATNNPGLKLREQIRQRFQISSDPVGIYTETLEETKALYDHLESKRRADENSIMESVVSINRLVPPREKQEENQKYLQKLDRLLKDLDPAVLEAE
ncbi:MAG: MMPL family transporter, partial [Myxococcota bacterium]